MKLTRAHRTAINAAARDSSDRRVDHCEVGERTCRARFDDPAHAGHAHHLNLAYFDGPGCDWDLHDMARLQDLRVVEDHPSGRTVLDIYVYARTYYGGRYRPFDYDIEHSHTLTAIFAGGELQKIEVD